MKRRPKISIVIPTHNFATYLGAAIRGVLDQSYADLELLVLDNHSTDRTPEVMAGFSDSRMIYRRNERNLGFNGNLSLGIDLARGEYILFLGADDILEKDFLATVVPFLDEHPKVSLVHSGAVWISSSGEPYGRSPRGWHTLTPGNEAFVECFRVGFCFSTMILRLDLVRRLKKEAGDTLPWEELVDSWFFLKSCLESDIGYVDAYLVRYRVHEKSLSLSMYATGELFEKHLHLTGQAFDWPEARERGISARRQEGIRHVALQSIRLAHQVRLVSSRRAYLRILSRILEFAPELLFYPFLWIRMTFFGLMPRAFIQVLQWIRRRRYARQAVRPQGTGGRPEIGQIAS